MVLWIPNSHRVRHHRSFVIRKNFEEDLVRQKHLIEEQLKFLENLGKWLTEYAFSAAKVTYYANDSLPDNAARRTAVQLHDENTWMIFKEIRAEIRKSKRLCSDEHYRKLIELYRQLEDLDPEILEFGQLEKPHKSDLQRLEKLHHKVHQELPDVIDDTLEALARGMKLIPSSDDVRNPK